MSQSLSTIQQNVRQILAELPEGVQLVAVAKGAEPEKILAAIEAGARIIGENYVQEAERAYAAVGKRAGWHFIGHLQRNKVKKAVSISDMVETVDSAEIAGEIDRRCAEAGRVMPVLIEVNSGGEEQKTGVLPEDAGNLAGVISALPNIRLMGLMTMGPRSGDPEESRPYFTRTKRVFDSLKALNLPNVDMKYLSMGMSNSYRVAVEEGANIIRIGTKIFGERV